MGRPIIGVALRDAVLFTYMSVYLKEVESAHAFSFGRKIDLLTLDPRAATPPGDAFEHRLARRELQAAGDLRCVQRVLVKLRQPN